MCRIRSGGGRDPALSQAAQKMGASSGLDARSRPGALNQSVASMSKERTVIEANPQVAAMRIIKLLADKGLLPD